MYEGRAVTDTKEIKSDKLQNRLYICCSKNWFYEKFIESTFNISSAYHSLFRNKRFILDEMT